MEGSREVPGGEREIVPYQSYVTRLLCRYLSLSYMSDIVQSVWTTSDMMDPSLYRVEITWLLIVC